MKNLKFSLTKDEYVEGQTWCYMRRQHVFFYIFLLMTVGITLEIKNIFMNQKISGALMISGIALFIFAIIELCISKRAEKIYISDDKNFEVSVSDEGIYIKCLDNKSSEPIYIMYSMMSKIKKLKKVMVIEIYKKQIFIIPCRIIESIDIFSKIK